MFATSSRAVRTAGEDRLLSGLCRTQLDILTQLDPDSLQIGGSLTEPVSGYSNVVESRQGRRSLVLWRVGEYTYTGSGLSPSGPDMKELTVRAQQLKGMGLTMNTIRRVDLRTYVAYPMYSVGNKDTEKDTNAGTDKDTDKGANYDTDQDTDLNTDRETDLDSHTDTDTGTDKDTDLLV